MSTANCILLAASNEDRADRALQIFQRSFCGSQVWRAPHTNSNIWLGRTGKGLSTITTLATCSADNPLVLEVYEREIRERDL